MPLNWIRKLAGKTERDAAPVASPPAHAQPVHVEALAPTERLPADAPPERAPIVVTVETVISLPWMEAFDAEVAQYGFGGTYSAITVPAGTDVFVDTVKKKARIIEPEGRIRSWDGSALLTVAPQQRYWYMVWQMLGADDPSVMFRPMDDHCDDPTIEESGFEFICEGLEGREGELFPQLVGLLNDPFFNPFGFPLKSGLYKRDMDTLCFRLNFGEGGDSPSIQVVDETVPAPLDFPYKTEISVKAPLQANGREIPPGYYRTEVTGFHVVTGRVSAIDVRHMANRYHVTGDAMVQWIHDGQVEILNILQDAAPNF